MDITTVVDLYKTLLIGAFFVTLPLMGFSLVITVATSIIQAIMQIQEQTLSFFPKLLAMGSVVYVLGFWMLEKLVTMIQDFIKTIPTLL